MENLRLLAFIGVLVVCISVTSGGLVLKDSASPEIAERALASATQQLEAFSLDHSGARVRRSIGDKDAELCDEEVATCQKDVLALGPADRTCVDLYKAANCTLVSFAKSDACGDGSVSTAKSIVASFMSGFFSLSCNPRQENYLYQLINKCADKYYTKVMRTNDPSRIADVVCCGHVELARCISSSLPAWRRTLFVESAHQRFQRVSRVPFLGFEGCDKFPVEKCSK